MGIAAAGSFLKNSLFVPKKAGTRNFTNILQKLYRKIVLEKIFRRWDAEILQLQQETSKSNDIEEKMRISGRWRKSEKCWECVEKRRRVTIFDENEQCIEHLCQILARKRDWQEMEYTVFYISKAGCWNKKCRWKVRNKTTKEEPAWKNIEKELRKPL